MDDELGAALAAAGPATSSRSRLIRDLALRGAQARQQDERRAAEAAATLLELSDGRLNYDFGAAEAMLRERADRLP